MTSITPPDSPTFTARNVAMNLLLSIAYGVDSTRITGPSWIESQQYDVSAKWEGGAKLTYEQLRAPLQKLLAERFQAAAHMERKEGSGFALVVAKNGPKVAASKGGEPFIYILKDGIRVHNQTLNGLAGALTSPAHAAVVNETGIEGKYDIDLKYAPEGNLNSGLPSFITALEEQAGLKLVTRKVPVEALVVDHIERTPAEN